MNAPRGPQLDRRSLMRYLSLGPVAIAAVSSGCGEDPVGGLDAEDFPDAAAADLGFEDAEAPDLGFGPDAGVDAGVDAGLGDASVSCEPTASDVTGPFFRAGAPSRTSLVGPDEPGDRLEITGVVLDPDCLTPLDGAVIDVWQADASGNYDTTSVDYRLRALLMSDQAGAFGFTSVRPGNYPDAGGMRPAHVHFTVIRPGYRSLTTQLYFRGDPFLAPNDSCTVCSSDEESLIIELREETREGVTWWVGQFRIVMSI